MKPKVVIAVLVLILAAAGWRLRERSQREAEVSGPLVLYGNVDIRELTLAFRVSGRVAGVSLEEGDRAVPGEVIAVLDQRPFEDELAVRSAQLREAQAAFFNAEKKFQRLKSLLANKSVSQSYYDDSLALRDEAEAKVDTARALV